MSATATTTQKITTIIKVDQKFNTPCSNTIRDAFNRVKLQLKQEGVTNIEPMFIDITKALDKLYETELSVYQQEYAIRLSIYFKKLKEAQDKNFDEVTAIQNIDKQITDFEKTAMNFVRNKEAVYALKQELLEKLKAIGINLYPIFG